MASSESARRRVIALMNQALTNLARHEQTINMLAQGSCEALPESRWTPVAALQVAAQFAVAGDCFVEELTRVIGIEPEFRGEIDHVLQ